ncbi:RNA polymerase sigma factor [Actinophytocola algeriensis]|uniref:RNA polymerase sigma factor (Sigma-70 family) n=1 Tax=Actinophytocola algeriensis TaxID=1768010 RepID=A0A7W7Q0D7_9PSEU|nr:sigma-70 family RNA polymerase sigma factor [Actinophytocola algeriensis]MBB4904538.1 RNA polymerase sigma factor (sigma-70 family) [Actinophytocola algeriensis]MBE1476603.1 RNA polymerase sigma factor (sigma-70 family) [Actinophytocola algeriensis]
MTTAAIEGLLRELAPQVLGAVVRRYGHFDAAEDAVQEALIAAATTWPDSGLPEKPKAWLITVASRRLTDLLRNEQARQRREDTWKLSATAPAADADQADDTLILLFLCCHPALPRTQQIALTLRSVAGLTTTEIARAFLVPEPTMAQRITRAKQRVKASGVPFRLPADREERLAAVLRVLYLIFTEGYASTAGPSAYRAELSREAIRLTRIVHRLMPRDGEVGGLLALMLLTDARRDARVGYDGALIPLAEQDRSLWHGDFVEEGVGLVTAAMSAGPSGPYQLQAAIAALHDEAPTAEETDWPQIEALYRVLAEMTGSPMAALNHAVAVAMARGPAPALAMVEELAHDKRLTGHHRLHSVRAHLLELSGDAEGALAEYQEAARGTRSLQEQRYLRMKASALAHDTRDSRDGGPAR